MTRISITLPAELQEELTLFAEDQKKSVSEVLRDAAERLVERERALKLEKAYEALFSLEGFVSGDYGNLSEEIDEILYGENGAWRGMQDED